MTLWTAGALLLETLGVELAGPSTHQTRISARRSASVDGRRRQRFVILPAREIGDHSAMEAAARVVVERLTAIGAPAGLARTAFATFVDNGLTHADDSAGPVAAVYLDGDRLTVTSRDLGREIAGCADPKLELVRRIQFPAEDVDPAPGAPAGIPWLAELLMRRCRGGRLEFMAGSGRLTFKDGVWLCRHGSAVDAFVAVAVLPLR